MARHNDAYPTRAQLRSLALKDDVAHKAALSRARALYASMPPITDEGRRQIEALAEHMREPKKP